MEERQPDTKKNTPVPVSAGILLALAAVVAVVSIAVGVLQVASHLGYSRWQDADAILGSLTNAIYLAGVLVGLGTLVMARSKGTSAIAQRMARLLLLAGVTLVLLGIADAVCINRGYLPYGAAIPMPGFSNNSLYMTSYMLSRLASTLFYAGVLGGLAYLCLRQASHLKSSTGEPLQKPGD